MIRLVELTRVASLVVNATYPSLIYYMQTTAIAKTILAILLL